LYAYDQTGGTPNCSDEESFLLTIKQSPVINTITNISACDSHVLPAITGASVTAAAQYYTATNGGGTAYAVGATINFADFPSYPVTLYAYDQTGGTPNCSDEESFLLTIKQTPVITPLVISSPICGSYTLPAINGTAITSNAQYYTATNGGGTAYAVGATINYADFATYPVTLYIYDATGTTPNCTDEESFLLTIKESPVFAAINDLDECDSYVLPAINGTGLNSGLQYHTATNGGGTAYAVGTTINYADFPSYPVTLYVYDQTGGTPNCTDEESFTLTIVQRPVITSLPNQVACETFTFPVIAGVNLSTNEKYYTETNGGGNSYAVGDTVNYADFTTYPVTLYMYDTTGGNSNCTDEETFTLIIGQTPVVNLIDDEFCTGDSIVLDATNLANGATAYLWNTGETTPIITVSIEGVYDVTVTSETCVTNASVQITENKNCIIPQGISPNNDGINDCFEISFLEASKLTVYNRYGTKVYGKRNYRNEWCGISDAGDELPVGTYYYVIELVNAEPITGWVYINREN